MTKYPDRTATARQRRRTERLAEAGLKKVPVIVPVAREDEIKQIAEHWRNEMNETETWIAWIDGRKDEAVEFEAPISGTFDIAEAGATALGIDVCEELNVERK